MIDPEFQHYLSGINASLTDIKNKKGPGIWRSFFNGMFSALGYIFGLAIIVIFLGWFLNKIGLLPQFQKQVSDFQIFISNAEKLMSGEGNQQNVKQQGNVYTLPNGQKVQVVQ